MREILVGVMSGKVMRFWVFFGCVLLAESDVWVTWPGSPDLCVRCGARLRVPSFAGKVVIERMVR
jgi:hypothetical protein